jgi:hypothetical protein
MTDSFAMHDVKFGLPKGRGKLIFNHSDSVVAAYNMLARLERSKASYVKTHRSIEFEGIASDRCFRITVMDANFMSDLVNEDNTCV